MGARLRNLSGPGWLYAITRMGPRCDLTKVGYTRQRPGFRIWTAISQEDARYTYQRDRYFMRLYLLAVEPQTSWVVKSECPKFDERACHDVLAAYRPLDPLHPRKAGSFKGIDSPKEFRICFGRELFRAPLDVILMALSVVTNEDPKEIPLQIKSRYPDLDWVHEHMKGTAHYSRVRQEIETYHERSMENYRNLLISKSTAAWPLDPIAAMINPMGGNCAGYQSGRNFRRSATQGDT